MDFVGLWNGLSVETKDIIKAILSPTVAVLLFIFAQILQIFLTSWNKHKERKRILIGIYREIADNLEQNAKTQFTPDIIEAIKYAIVADENKSGASSGIPRYRPFIAITESSRFYDSIASSLPVVKTECLIKISAYYRSVLDQTLIAEGIKGSAFHTISVQSRCELIDELTTVLKESAKKAADALSSMERRYKKAWFKHLRLQSKPSQYCQSP